MGPCSNVSLYVGSEKGGVEDRVNLPLRGDVEVECHAGDSLLYFEGTCSFHLEFLRSVHVEVGGLKPDLVFYSTGSELGGYSFLHLSLGYCYA